MQKQQGQFLSMTLLALHTFKNYYDEIEFEENCEGELLDFFDNFMGIFNMPVNQILRSYCGHKVDQYLSEDIEDLELITQLLSVIKTYNENPTGVTESMKNYLIEAYKGGENNYEH